MKPQPAELECWRLREGFSTQQFNFQEPKEVGACTPGVDWGYILWFHDWKESNLTVLRLRETLSDERVVALLHAAATEAQQYKLNKVWDPSERLERLLGIKSVARSRGLPALLCLGE